MSTPSMRLWSTLGITLTILISAMCWALVAANRVAYADDILTFANGGTATRGADGSIRGSANVVWSGSGTSYSVTMPDGTVLSGSGDSESYPAPYDGTYGFVARPSGGSYAVALDTGHASYWQTAGERYAHENANLQTRTQAVNVPSWTPDLRSVGSLKVSVASSDASTLFPLTVRLSTGEQHSFSLRNGDYETIDGIPAGATYEVSQSAGSAWAVTIENASGTISAGVQSECVVTNSPVRCYLQAQMLMGGLFSGNGMYSTSGTKFGVYLDSSAMSQASDFDGNPATLVAGQDGRSQVLALHAGNYWLRQVEAGPGVAADSRIYGPFTLGGDDTQQDPEIVPVMSQPVVFNGFIHKRDAITGATASAGATLGGAVFRIDYFDSVLTEARAVALRSSASKTWYVITDSSGNVAVNGFTFTNFGSEQSDAAWTHHGSIPVMPLGSYLVEEVQAPSGYSLPSEAARRHFVVMAANGDHTSTSQPFDVTQLDSTVTGGVTVEKFDAAVHAAGYGSVAQGATDHASTYDIVNMNAGPVVYRGKSYASGATIASMVAKKGSDGSWVANLGSIPLPYGRYKVVEASAGKGMLLDEGWSAAFEISGEGSVSLSQDNVAVHGGIRIVKVDQDTLSRPLSLLNTDRRTLAANISGGQGDAKLIGAEFTIYNGNGNPVLVDGRWVGPGEEVLTISTSRELVQCVAQTAIDALPYGTYEVRETKPPVGYKPIVGVPGGTVHIDADHEYVYVGISASGTML